MNRLAAFIMAGRGQAVAVLTGFAVLALLLPPLALLSGAALALVTLRLGANAGLSVLGLSVLAMTALGALAGQPMIGLVYGVSQWLPMLILAWLLRETVSLALSLRVLTAFGLLSVLVVHILVADPAAQWLALLDRYLRPVLVETGIPEAAIEAALQQAATLMTGSLVAGMALSLALMLLMGRWWQALLYNPGGFRREFTSLQLGWPLAIVTLGLLAVALLGQAAPVIELALVAGTLFFLQGLALAHSLAGLAANPLPWLIGVYGLLVLMLPQMMGLLAALGVIDAFADFRARLRIEQS